MVALPDAWLESERPAQIGRWRIVTGRTFQRRVQMQAGSPLSAVPLTDCTVSCALNDKTGTLVAYLDADITDAANGWIRVRMEPDTTAAIVWPSDDTRNLVGGYRLDIVVTDTNGDRVSVVSAEIEIMRGETP